jgi:hypothetical protein
MTAELIRMIVSMLSGNSAARPSLKNRRRLSRFVLGAGSDRIFEIEDHAVAASRQLFKRAGIFAGR